MKNVEFTVAFSADIPDDVSVDDLYLNIPVEQVKVSQGPNREVLNNAVVHDFETIGVRDFDQEYYSP